MSVHTGEHEIDGVVDDHARTVRMGFMMVSQLVERGARRKAEEHRAEASEAREAAREGRELMRDATRDARDQAQAQDRRDRLAADAARQVYLPMTNRSEVDRSSAEQVVSAWGAAATWADRDPRAEVAAAQIMSHAEDRWGVPFADLVRNGEPGPVVDLEQTEPPREAAQPSESPRGSGRVEETAVHDLTRAADGRWAERATDEQLASAWMTAYSMQTDPQNARLATLARETVEEQIEARTGLDAAALADRLVYSTGYAPDRPEVPVTDPARDADLLGRVEDEQWRTSAPGSELGESWAAAITADRLDLLEVLDQEMTARARRAEGDELLIDAASDRLTAQQEDAEHVRQERLEFLAEDDLRGRSTVEVPGDEAAERSTRDSLEDRAETRARMAAGEAISTAAEGQALRATPMPPADYTRAPKERLGGVDNANAVTAREKSAPAFGRSTGEGLLDGANKGLDHASKTRPVARGKAPERGL